MTRAVRGLRRSVNHSASACLLPGPLSKLGDPSVSTSGTPGSTSSPARFGLPRSRTCVLARPRSATHMTSILDPDAVDDFPEVLAVGVGDILKK